MPSDYDDDLDELLDEPERFERTAEVDRVDRAMKRMRIKGYTGTAGWERAFAEVGPGGTERFSRDAQPSAVRPYLEAIRSPDVTGPILDRLGPGSRVQPGLVRILRRAELDPWTFCALRASWLADVAAGAKRRKHSA